MDHLTTIVAALIGAVATLAAAWIGVRHVRSSSSSEPDCSEEKPDEGKIPLMAIAELGKADPTAKLTSLTLDKQAATSAGQARKHLVAGERDDGIEDLKKCVECTEQIQELGLADPNTSRILLGRRLMDLADELLLRGDKSEAVRLVKQALSHLKKALSGIGKVDNGALTGMIMRGERILKTQSHTPEPRLNDCFRSMRALGEAVRSDQLSPREKAKVQQNLMAIGGAKLQNDLEHITRSLSDADPRAAGAKPLLDIAKTLRLSGQL